MNVSMLMLRPNPSKSRPTCSKSGGVYISTQSIVEIDMTSVKHIPSVAGIARVGARTANCGNGIRVPIYAIYRYDPVWTSDGRAVFAKGKRISRTVASNNPTTLHDAISDVAAKENVKVFAGVRQYTPAEYYYRVCCQS